MVVRFPIPVAVLPLLVVVAVLRLPVAVAVLPQATLLCFQAVVRNLSLNASMEWPQK